MQKVYIASNRNDAELEKAIYEMDVYFLRIALYGIARGDSFDDAFSLAEHAAQQSVQPTLLESPRNEYIYSDNPNDDEGDK